MIDIHYDTIIYFIYIYVPYDIITMTLTFMFDTSALEHSHIPDIRRLQVLRQRRFALRDLFDLTRPPERGEGESAAAAGSLGGLHALEIQVWKDWAKRKLKRCRKHVGGLDPNLGARPQASILFVNMQAALILFRWKT